jgi:hypothetical protein
MCVVLLLLLPSTTTAKAREQEEMKNRGKKPDGGSLSSSGGSGHNLHIFFDPSIPSTVPLFFENDHNTVQHDGIHDGHLGGRSYFSSSTPEERDRFKLGIEQSRTRAALLTRQRGRRNGKQRRVLKGENRNIHSDRDASPTLRAGPSRKFRRVGEDGDDLASDWDLAITKRKKETKDETESNEDDDDGQEEDEEAQGTGNETTTFTPSPAATPTTTTLSPTAAPTTTISGSGGGGFYPTNGGASLGSNNDTSPSPSGAGGPAPSHGTDGGSDPTDETLHPEGSFLPPSGWPAPSPSPSVQPETSPSSPTGGEQGCICTIASSCECTSSGEDGDDEHRLDYEFAMVSTFLSLRGHMQMMARDH